MRSKKLKTKYFLTPLLLLFFLYLSLCLFVGSRVYIDNKQASDAIVVLGAKAKLGDKDSPCLVSRVNHAVELYKNGFAKNLIVSGGNDEAITMKRIALQNGVEENNIFIETQSTSTYENFLYSKHIMQEKNISSVIIVTEPFHSPRAALVATNLGIENTVSPATDSPCWTEWTFLSRYFLREPFAILFYKLQGKI